MKLTNEQINKMLLEKYPEAKELWQIKEGKQYMVYLENEKIQVELKNNELLEIK